MLAIITLLAFFAIGFTVGIFWGNSRGIPFVEKKDYLWAIGIYAGNSPLELRSPDNLKNPVLTAKDVTDVTAEFVADPFMIRSDNEWYMFFEVMNQRGEIGLAQSTDARHWKYQKIVLREPFHLSYPYVFTLEGECYMIPEANQTNSVRLYKATDFPSQWSFVNTLLQGYRFTDTSVVYFQDTWWMFTAISLDVLLLYYAESLFGPWTLHSQSPIIMGDLKRARPAGRVLVFGNRMMRFAQDASRSYGNNVLAFEVMEITKTSYKERAVKGDPILKASGSGWNAKGMHQIDAHQISGDQWIACVDGYREGLTFGLRY